MKLRLILLTALFFVQLSHAEAKAKVFILSGQSNMSGGGHVVEGGLQFDAAVGDKVKIWDASDIWNKRGILGKWASLNELQVIKKEMSMDMIGPEFGFAKAMSELYPAEEIHLIKVAKGGTPINFWLPDEKGKANGHTQLLDNLKNALEKIEGEYEIAGMLWMQGESDSKKQEDAEAYQKKLEQLIALMRKANLNCLL
jgi:Carbohydrate esterase, sialic acid-specific acetylesterase